MGTYKEIDGNGKLERLKACQEDLSNSVESIIKIHLLLTQVFNHGICANSILDEYMVHI